jgi:hypothetical protein
LREERSGHVERGRPTISRARRLFGEGLAHVFLFGHLPSMHARTPPPLPSAEEASALAGRAFTLALLALVPCCGVQIIPASFAAFFAQRARRSLVLRGVHGGSLWLADAGLLLAGLVITVNAALFGLAALATLTGHNLNDSITWEEFDRRGLRFPVGGPVVPFGKEPAPLVTLPKRIAVTNEPLRDQLAAALRDAGEGKRVVVMTSYEGCAACDEVWATFDDPLLHHALPEVTIVRVDVEAFSVEMGELGMTREAHPWFFLLGEDGKPVEAVSADAWTENVPMNVAKGLRDWLDAAKTDTRPGTISL